MASLIHTPTPNLARSKTFFSQLDFTEFTLDNLTHFTDGKCIIQISTDHFVRPGVKLYQENWREELDKLKDQNIYPIEGGHFLKDPNGVSIYLMEGQLDLPELASFSPSLLGNLAGVGIESVDMKASAAFWEILGFSLSMGSVDQGWFVMQNQEGMGVSFMKALSCPHMFLNPSLTFFNGKNNLTIIEEIRKREIPIEQEITVFNSDGIVDNIILREPGGYGFFIFSD